MLYGIVRKYVWEKEGDYTMNTPTQTPSLSETMKEWHYALAYEIKHWKTIGGSKISIMNGRFYIQIMRIQYTYFQLISEVST